MQISTDQGGADRGKGTCQALRISGALRSAAGRVATFHNVSGALDS